jgi:hypothetical protein
MEAIEEGGADVESSFPASVLGAGSSTFWLKLNGGLLDGSLKESTVTSSGTDPEMPVRPRPACDKHAR